jgi:PAS domain S-box-containing protein
MPNASNRPDFRALLEGGPSTLEHADGADAEARAAALRRQHEETFSTLIEHAPFGVYVVDAAFRLRAINRGAEKVFGEIDPLLGRDFGEVLRLIWTEPFASEAIERFRHTLETGEPFVSPTITENRRNVPRTESYDWQLRRVTLPDGTHGVVCYFHDLTPLREAEAALAAAAERDAFLVSFSDAIRSFTKARDVTRVATERLGRHLRVGAAVYTTVDAAGECAIVEDDWNDGTIALPQGRLLLGDFGETMVSALARGQTVTVTDVHTDPRTAAPGIRPAYDRLSVRALVTVPLVKDGRLVAMLSLADRSPRNWTPSDLALAEEVAERTWSAVERARAQLALRRRTAQLETLVRRAPIGVYLVDHELRILQVNPIARAVFGETDPVGLAFEEVVHRLWSAAFADEVVALFRHTLATGHSYVSPERAEQRIDRGDVEYYEWRIDRIPLPENRHGVVCYFRDISASVRARIAVAASEARLQLALDASGMGTFLWHVREDRTEADDRMLAHFGLSPHSAISLASALGTLIHPDDRRRYADAVARAIDPKGPGTLREDIRVEHADGSLRWLAVTGRVTFEGQPRRATTLAGVVADITEWKRTEERLRENEAQLKESDRRKDEFLAVLAHELRNPLAPVRTGLELIRLAGETPGSVARVRGMMERQVDHMVRLIDDLLDVSRITSGKIRLQRIPTPLTTLINNAVEANRAAITTGQFDLTVDLPDTVRFLDVDPTRFVQVVSNLLHNATKFTEPGGRIRIAGRLEPATPGWIAISVEDSGIGIAPDVLPHVFDLFAQGSADGSQTGLGIGLALARQLVEMHGGQIEARSDGPGRGSHFTIRMPLMPGTGNPEPPGQRPLHQLARRVVVIDDNEDAANSTAMLIEALGGESRVAYRGETGVRLVLEYQPDVVLLDIGMPAMDGYETCRRLRAAMGTDLFLVAVTGFGQERDKDRATAAGFDAHLTKPADPVALAALLEAAPRRR